jgi:hypothetical protein
MSDERKKGFDEAINKVLDYAREEADRYATLYNEAPPNLKKQFHYKAIAMIDFKLLIERLFKMEVFIND